MVDMKYVTWYVDNQKQLLLDFIEDRTKSNYKKYIEDKWREVDKDEIIVGEMETINPNWKGSEITQKKKTV